MTFTPIVLQKNFYPLHIKIFPRIILTEPVFYEMPVTSENGDNMFTTDIGGKRLKFRFWYNRRMNLWTMSIWDDQEAAIVTGRAVVLGIDLIGQYNDTRLPDGQIVAVNLDESDPGHEAGEFDFGTRVKVYYVQQEMAET